MQKVSLISFVIIFVFSCNKNEKIDEIEVIPNEVVEIYLLETLDESRGFCLDIKGYKSNANIDNGLQAHTCCLLYTSPSPRDGLLSRMPSSA